VAEITWTEGRSSVQVVVANTHFTEGFWDDEQASAADGRSLSMRGKNPLSCRPSTLSKASGSFLDGRSLRGYRARMPHPRRASSSDWNAWFRNAGGMPSDRSNRLRAVFLSLLSGEEIAILVGRDLARSGH